MTDHSYNQFCPVAMASEILCTRWTLIVLRELIAGSARFNELRRGVPRMSPALLSKRLKELEAAGIVMRKRIAGEADAFAYQLTPAGLELKPVIETIGCWGHRWIETEASLKNLDPNLLMWDIRRNIDPKPMPKGRSTIEFIFSDLPQAHSHWWLIVEPDQGTDLCSIDPGFDVDLYLTTDLRTMTEIWMGFVAPEQAKSNGQFVATGNRQLEASLNAWLSLSRFAKVPRLVA